MRSHFLSFALAIALSLLGATQGSSYNQILIPEKSHPAIRSAAQIIAHNLSLPDSAIQSSSAAGSPKPGQLLLSVGPDTPEQRTWLGGTVATLKHDGYVFVAKGGGGLIRGVRPRSLLFAAGDTHLWRSKTSGSVVRDPAFAIRTATHHGRKSIAEYVAALGINTLIGSREGVVTFKDTLPEVYRALDATTRGRLDAQSQAATVRCAEFAQECRDADIEYFPFIYGNDLSRWSAPLHEAALKVFPTAQGKPAPTSWERAALCPSDPATWKIVEAYVKEFAQKGQGDGLYVTFWDHYGIYCQCDRCVKSGMNQFPNQLGECVRHYEAALAPLGKKLVVRTWSSGVPHWLGEQWVHAPGYGGFGGAGTSLWARVIAGVPASVMLQTKVYESDCEPDPPFSSLLGHARPHTEIAEWQITGQTTGRFYFPASTVNHTARTMKQALGLVGPSGGVSLYPGATAQSNFDLLDDIANSINVRAWRELAWQPDADLDRIWLDWAVPIFGARAAPRIVKALRLSESTVNRLFSALGLGSDTNSGFPSTIDRRETLLKYTNRFYRPEGLAALSPTRENIQKVIAEKEDCLRQIDQMLQELELAKPDLTPAQAAELGTRFRWLREFAIVARHLDESLWRYRYLRYLDEMLTTDPAQMQALAASYDAVKEHQARLFQFDPAQRFSCYSVPLGQLRARPSLGNPLPLMQELYNKSLLCVEQSTGPEGVPAQWRR